jgi:feruloyl esterase
LPPLCAAVPIPIFLGRRTFEPDTLEKCSNFRYLAAGGGKPISDQADAISHFEPKATCELRHAAALAQAGRLEEAKPIVAQLGWADPMIPSPVGYFNGVTQSMFGSLSAQALVETQKFARLFMAPGLWHCGMSVAAGPGPNSFGSMVQQPAPSFDAKHDLLSALTLWVEKGIPPTLVIATKYNDDQPQHGIAMQRPICVFPETAEYEGISNYPNLPASFKCVVNHPSDYNNQKPAPQYGP